MISEYSDLFKETVCEKPQMKCGFHLKNNVALVYFRPREIPFAIKQGGGRLTPHGKKWNHWEDATHHLGTPIVPVIGKGGKVRICTNYKVPINSFLKDGKYPIPTIDEIFSKMNRKPTYVCLLLTKVLYYKQSVHI